MVLVKPARKIQRLRKKKYNTGDIVSLVQEVIKTDSDDTEGLARQFPTTKNGLMKLFNHAANRFIYTEDPEKNQWVQAPSYLYHISKEGDCKSFTVFLISVIRNMGLKSIVRYVSYGSKDYRHVYPIAILPTGEQVVMDLAYYKQEGGAFGTEKPFFKKKDIIVEGLYKLGTVGNTKKGVEDSIAEMERLLRDIPDSIITDGVGDVTKMSNGQLDKYLMQDRLSAFAMHEKNPLKRKVYLDGVKAFKKGTIAGIGSIESSDFGIKLQQFINKANANTTPAFKPFKLQISKPSAHELSGLKDFLGKIGKAFGKLFKKLMNWVFKGAAKKMAPFFLFTFIKKKVSPEVDRRKLAQTKIFKWIQKIGKFDQKKLETLIFNEIKKETGKTPKELLNGAANGKKIGVLPAALVAKAPEIIKAMGLVVEVIKKVGGLFKKEKESEEVTKEVNEENAPDLEVLAKETTDEDIGADEQDPKGEGSGGLAIAAGIATFLGLFAFA